MAKPTSKPNWTLGNPSFGTVTIEPSAGKKQTGWTAGERPPHQTMNWLFYNIGTEWIDYLEGVTDALLNLQGIFDAVVGTGGDFTTLSDMVADAELHLYREVNSMRFRNTRSITLGIWNMARRLGVREFIPRNKHEVRDDHLPLNNIAKIPTCDIIDFDYPRPGRTTGYWHTQQDTPDKCSALSLAKVGWVVHEWMKTVK